MGSKESYSGRWQCVSVSTVLCQLVEYAVLTVRAERGVVPTALADGRVGTDVTLSLESVLW